MRTYTELIFFFSIAIHVISYFPSLEFDLTFLLANYLLVCINGCLVLDGLSRKGVSISLEKIEKAYLTPIWFLIPYALVTFVTSINAFSIEKNGVYYSIYRGEIIAEITERDYWVAQYNYLRLLSFFMVVVSYIFLVISKIKSNK